MYASKRLGRRKRKTMDIDSAKLSEAKKILAAKNDTDTVDLALDLVVSNRQIQRAMMAAHGKLPHFKLK